MDEKTFNIIQKIADEHSHKKFGYLTKEDLKNEIWIICLEKLKEFDHSRGELEHFLRVLVKNRLVNRYKDITKAIRSPCPRCPYYDKGGSPSDCAKYGDDRHLCSKWYNYQLSLKSRKSLLNSSSNKLERVKVDNILTNMIGKEVYEDLLTKLDKKYKRDLCEIMNGGKISKKRLSKLRKQIDKVLCQDPDLVKLTVKNKDVSET